MTERSIVQGIQAYLKGLPECWFFKVHGSPVQTAGIPDLLGCYRGRLFALEVKMPGKEPTPLQASVMRQIARAGGLVAVVRSVGEVMELLQPPAPIPPRSLNWLQTGMTIKGDRIWIDYAPGHRASATVVMDAVTARLMGRRLLALAEELDGKAEARPPLEITR